MLDWKAHHLSARKQLHHASGEFFVAQYMARTDEESSVLHRPPLLDCIWAHGRLVLLMHSVTFYCGGSLSARVLISADRHYHHVCFLASGFKVVSMLSQQSPLSLFACSQGHRSVHLARQTLGACQGTLVHALEHCTLSSIAHVSACFSRYGVNNHATGFCVDWTGRRLPAQEGSTGLIGMGCQ